jgi:hypothetical protein
MYSITLAGHTVTPMQILGIAALLLATAAFLLAIARQQRLALKKSAVTEDFQFQLERIAQALERLADQGASRRMQEAAQRSARNAAENPMRASVAEEEQRRPGRIAYSVLGR